MSDTIAFSFILSFCHKFEQSNLHIHIREIYVWNVYFEENERVGATWLSSQSRVDGFKKFFCSRISEVSILPMLHGLCCLVGDLPQLYFTSDEGIYSYISKKASIQLTISSICTNRQSQIKLSLEEGQELNGKQTKAKTELLVLNGPTEKTLLQNLLSFYLLLDIRFKSFVNGLRSPIL